LNVARNLEGRGQYSLNTGPGGAPSLDEYNIVYLGLGSNISPVKNLVNGLAFLRQYVDVQRCSSVWETAPVPAIGPNYLNAAVLIQTNLTPGLLKTIILRRIEVQLGRVRMSNKNAPRTIDMDILIYDGQLMDLKVWTHAFLAVPLAELLPDSTNPASGETLRQVADRLAKDTLVKIRPDIHLDGWV
jgi:2-amino-4-hydroxy-6-hydroxymethyldihydropteridine diphosphokinase